MRRSSHGGWLRTPRSRSLFQDTSQGKGQRLGKGATLARESGLCYANIPTSTGYDCWHETEEDVSIEMILEIMRKNAENVIRIML